MHYLKENDILYNKTYIPYNIKYIPYNKNIYNNNNK